MSDIIPLEVDLDLTYLYKSYVTMVPDFGFGDQM